MKVSLVATVKDAGAYIEEFLESVRAQTRPPDEVVIVDGGSHDGTWDVLSTASELVALSEPGANIARGRNIAIRAAAHDVVAVTDADCVLEPDWLEHILAPLERGADVAAGSYRPMAESFWQVCAAAVSIPEPEEVRPGWMPSARSIAFRRSAFDAAGGYPEWLEVGEDMYFNHRLLETGARMELASDAVTHWRVRPTSAATWRQFGRYAEGDAVGGMYPERHALRFATYAFAGLALARRRRWMLMVCALGAAVYAARPIRRARRRLPADGPDRWKALLAVPALMAFIDMAKMWGYLRGLGRRPPPRRSPGSPS